MIFHLGTTPGGRAVEIFSESGAHFGPSNGATLARSIPVPKLEKD